MFRRFEAWTLGFPLQSGHPVPPTLPFLLRWLDGLSYQFRPGVNAQSAIQTEVLESAIRPIVAIVVLCAV